MNRKLKQQLNSAFEPPVPIKKDAFLQTFNYPKESYFNFICYQIGYIRKYVWAISALLLVIALGSLYYIPEEGILEIVWIVSSLLPFVTLLTVTEISRSASYNMAELEMSCKFNLSDIILVRMGILGTANFMLFVIILVFTMFKTDYSILRLGTYIVVPFLLTLVLSLVVLNHMRSRETIYVCAGISCGVSVLYSVLRFSVEIAFTYDNLYIWGILCCILIISAVIQIKKLIKKTEELQWSLPLTA